MNINNKRASFDYEFLENYTAGIVFTERRSNQSVPEEPLCQMLSAISRRDSFMCAASISRFMRGAHGDNMLLCVTVNCCFRNVN